VLNLAADTPPEWTTQALDHLDEILLDHAHCEKKAAGAAVNLLFRYPQHAFLQAPLSALAREELLHFEQVLAQLAARGRSLERQKPSLYGGLLHREIRGFEPARLLDTLLVSALIEARSCERFRLLAESIPEPELARFYRELLACEARHHQIYIELATRLSAREPLRKRLGELALAEARACASPAPRVRLHSGLYVPDSETQRVRRTG